MKLGAIEFSHVAPGKTSLQVLEETLDIAQLVDELGYSRLWLGEHHSHNVAHSSPEILAGLVAGTTEHISVGAGGILLNWRNPLRIAGAFRLLSALFPGRIDLGIARGGVDKLRRPLLGFDKGDWSYNHKVIALLQYLRQEGPVQVSPIGTDSPNVWILGSRTESAKLAAEHGTAFCVAAFFSESYSDAVEICKEYQRTFQPRDHAATPHCAIAFAGVCAATESAAHAGRDHSNVEVRSVMLDTPTVLADKINQLCFESSADEVLFLDLSKTYEQKQNTYKLLANDLLR